VNSIPKCVVPSRQDLYEKVLKRYPNPLPGFDDTGSQEQIISERTDRLHRYLMDRADRLDTGCDNCDDKFARKSESRYLYDTPWEVNPRELNFCSDKCGDDYYYAGDFSYQFCEPCERDICIRNPADGWMFQFKDYDGEELCLKCYMGEILDHGIEREKLEGGQIPGMFFNHGNPEALEAGYETVEGFDHYFIRDPHHVKRFTKKALELIDQDKKVVVGYEKMAIGGIEGYVTMMVKNEM